MNVLFATSEIFPLIKTGGLADVSQSLTAALGGLGLNVTVILPGYRQIQSKLPSPTGSYTFSDAFLPDDIQLLEYDWPGKGVRLLVVNAVDLFDRDGGPYADVLGSDWPDNARRFAAFCRAITALLAGRSTCSYRFDVVHCNDWQSALVPALVQHEQLPVRSLMTIHNLAYQGVFPRSDFDALHLPESWWHYEAAEFYGNFSFLKAGIVFADAVTTVSPTYAGEILQEPLACGMSGLLQFHRHKLHGILNGADYGIWNPAHDALIRFPFDAENLAEKLHNKLDLQRALGLKLGKSIPLIGMVSRLVHQKGVDWVIAVIQALLSEKVQWVILGNGDKTLERQLQALAVRLPKQIALHIGYDEALAHRIEAGSDLFIMPSRYEPCGLNQIYSLCYGTVPIVRATGGLADTVADTTEASVKAGTATGFVYHGDTASDLEQCVRRAIGYFSKRKTWEKIQKTGMAQRFDWQNSALQYRELYRHRDDRN